jgi:hypothetical protein
MEVEVVEAQLPDSGSSTGITSLTNSHHTIRKVLKKEYSEVTIKKFYEWQNFSFIACNEHS